jgi:hypothetical protein
LASEAGFDREWAGTAVVGVQDDVVRGFADGGFDVVELCATDVQRLGDAGQRLADQCDVLRAVR